MICKYKNCYDTAKSPFWYRNLSGIEGGLYCRRHHAFMQKGRLGFKTLEEAIIHHITQDLTDDNYQ